MLVRDHHPPTRPRRETAYVILIVDDEEAVRRLVAAVLATHGYAVLEAGHGLEGLTLLRRHAPDLVLLDLHMPVMDGREFRAAQKALEDRRLAAIPVLVFSSEPTALDHELEAAGAIAKPFEPQELLAAVQQTLG